MKASDVMSEWFRRVWCEGEDAAIDELLHPEAQVFGLGAEVVIGPAAFRGFWEGLRSSFSDIDIRVVDAVDDGNRTYMRCEGSMTFDGSEVPLEGGGLCRVEDGRITHCWNYWDFLGLLAGMGALPADAFARACGGECFDALSPPPR